MVLINIQHFCSVQLQCSVLQCSALFMFSCSVVSKSLQPYGLSCQASPSVTISQSLLKLMSSQCYRIISSFVALFSSCLQSFPASGSIPESQLFASGGQSTGASASVPPIKIQDCFPLWLIGLITLLSKGLSRVFSKTTIWKNQFFGVQPSLQSNSHIHTWLLEKP